MQSVSTALHKPHTCHSWQVACHAASHPLGSSHGSPRPVLHSSALAMAGGVSLCYYLPTRHLSHIGDYDDDDAEHRNGRLRVVL